MSGVWLSAGLSEALERMRHCRKGDEVLTTLDLAGA